MTNSVFPSQTYQPEQDLLDSLVIEAIGIYGQDAYYLPRKRLFVDDIMTEDRQGYFDEAVPLDVYVKTADGFQGEGHFLSRWGLEIRDQIVFTISRTRWQELVGDPRGIPRPDEGDLIFFPLNAKCYEVRYVEKWPVFYPLGTLPMFDLVTELFENSGQKFTTGIPAIDSIMQPLTLDVFQWSVTNESGQQVVLPSGDYWVADDYDPVIADPLDQSASIEAESLQITDFSETSPFGDEPY